MLTQASRVLNTGLDGRVYLGQVTLVIPSYWRDARCHSSVPSPKPGVIYQVKNINFILSIFTAMQSKKFTLSFKRMFFFKSNCIIRFSL